MPKQQPLLEGQVIDAGDAAMLAEQLDRLEKKIREKKDELREIEKANLTASAKLRALHVALCAFFDEPIASGSVEPSSSRSVWEDIKQRYPGKKSEIIDLLIIQKQMTINQVAASLKCSYYTARDVLNEMRKQGLLENNGDGYTLKEI